MSDAYLIGKAMKIKKKILVLTAVLFSCLTGNIQSANAGITVAQAFYTLASQNNAQKIESLLRRGYSLESVNEEGYNAVCLSVAKNDKKTYNTLTSYGANKKPSCLKKLPADVFKRFFGYYPQTEVTPSYVPDSPYVLGTAALAAGAVTAAYLLRGSTGGSSGGDKKPENPDDNPGGDDPTPPEPIVPDDCPPNSSYSNLTKQCVCDYGYDHFGDENACYREIDNCAEQKADKCTKCEGKYVLKNNVCYAPISFCSKQDGEICTQCDRNYGTYGGDGKVCYLHIDQCVTQERDTCKDCATGFGTHTDPHHCYADVEHCAPGQQVLTACRLCEDGFDTFGDPNADVCYDSNKCAKYPNAVPTDKGKKCICDINRGYEGEPGNCTRTEEGNYQEGDGMRDEWNDLNARFCNSHGKYIDLGGGAWKCSCYPGYDNDSPDCSQCDTKNGYEHFGNDSACFKDKGCEKTFGENFTQQGNDCVCKEGFLPVNNQCYAPAQCTINQIQVKDAGEEDACKCKPNFNEECTACINDNFTYNPETGDCNPKECPEHWSGYMCSVCPTQFKITVGEDGERHCGLECADNRKPISENDEMCSTCADGYRDSPLYGTCIKDSCSEGVPGYIEVEGQCVCDEDNGYAMSSTGECLRKGEDFIGLSNANVNNGTINIVNNEFRDVYGMKPFMEEGEGEDKTITYFDEVYNSYAAAGNERGTISITNQDTGNIAIYGIYAPSRIYNAAAVNSEKENVQDVTSKGTIKIEDTNSFADIYGIVGSDKENIYNSFAHNRSDGGLSEPSISKSEGLINIIKSGETTGEIVGIDGSGFIYNAYANTDGGSAANVNALGEINITNKSSGDVIGIKQNSTDTKVNNAMSFMNSAVSDAVSTGRIKVSGKGIVYGIKSNATVANSETQFNQSYSKVGNFSSEGIIEATTDTDIAAAYGIYLDGDGKEKKEIYNAMGYNSIGTIKATNTKGGSAYGIYSFADTYEDKEEDGKTSVVYNNVYNAFRSSQKYGGDNVAAVGNIEATATGRSSTMAQLIGAYTKGNMFNAFTNSGADVKLESFGNIVVEDASKTAMEVRGIESEGITIANAYSMGQNKNKDTKAVGNITVNITGEKSGKGEAAGIYTRADVSQNAQIFNAALINDQSKVEGNITVQSQKNYTFSKMYGIYAESKGEDSQRKNIYNAYYENIDGVSAGSVKGVINVKTDNVTIDNEGEYYGIYVNNGTAYNAYSSNPNANVTGEINVDIFGSNHKSIAVGMYGNNATLNNSGKSTINVKASGTGAEAYGMKGDNNSIIYNDGRINVQSKYSDAYGIHLTNGVVTNDSNGSINVIGKGKNYGIYAVSEGKNTATVLNKGYIFVDGGDNTGIYASGANTTVQNTGIIVLENTENYCQGEDCRRGKFIVLNNGATFNNAGKLSTSGSFDFDAMGGNVTISKNGKFEAGENISGDLKVATDVVTDTFDKTSYIEDALSADNVSGVNLSSNSYLYHSKLKENAEGKYDVVMEMKDFAEITDADKAAYLEQNYNNKKNNDLFNILKATADKRQKDQAEADAFGTAVIPNFAMENLKVQRNLDKTMMSELFKGEEDIRKMVGGDTLFSGRDDHGTLTGYDLDSQSMYALYDKKLDNRYRLGLGMSITRMNTDYNNDSTRKNFMVQGYVPLTYTNGKGLTGVSMARLGFADGEYKRRSQNRTYEADTNEITYGLINELRYKVNLGGVNFTPFVGINAAGWYQDSMKEGNSALDINTAASHVFSLESALGIYVDKEVEFNQDSKLNLALGVGYYHEFANPYRGFSAHHGDSLGKYKLRDIEHLNSRNRGILSAKVNYDYKDFSIYGELLQYLEDEYPLDIDVGLKYRF